MSSSKTLLFPSGVLRGRRRAITRTNAVSERKSEDHRHHAPSPAPLPPRLEPRHKATHSERIARPAWAGHAGAAGAQVEPVVEPPLPPGVRLQVRPQVHGHGPGLPSNLQRRPVRGCARSETGFGGCLLCSFRLFGIRCGGCFTVSTRPLQQRTARIRGRRRSSAQGGRRAASPPRPPCAGGHVCAFTERSFPHGRQGARRKRTAAPGKHRR